MKNWLLTCMMTIKEGMLPTTLRLPSKRIGDIKRAAARGCQVSSTLIPVSNMWVLDASVASLQNCQTIIFRKGRRQTLVDDGWGRTSQSSVSSRWDAEWNVRACRADLDWYHTLSIAMTNKAVHSMFIFIDAATFSRALKVSRSMRALTWLVESSELRATSPTRVVAFLKCGWVAL